ncbi:MAG: hypothetical protein ABSA68_17250 [Xanthobacteraceae bacterium]|jgi:hypothetical protein
MSAFKVPNHQLLQAGLGLMEQNGQPLQRIEAKGRAMVYRTTGGKTVRVRTCNDHVLVAVAESPNPEAKLNIEGTDSILIVMPETPRTPGPVMAYFIPTALVVEEVRSNHRNWLASNPSTKGENRTWAIWFDDDGPAKASGYSKKWASYRLDGSANTRTFVNGREDLQTGSTTLGEVIADAKRRIAAVAGIPETAVKVTLDI